MRTKQPTTRSVLSMALLLAIGLTWLNLGLVPASLAMPTGPDLPTPQQLQTMPGSVQIGDRTYRLELSLWRDLMPIVPKGGRPLYTQIKLIADGAIPKDGPTIDGIWIFQGSRSWRSTKFDPPQRSKDQLTLETTARTGPKLSPKSKVDVVVQIHDRIGKRYWLRMADQIVTAVY
jgi:hypothetical protein